MIGRGHGRCLLGRSRELRGRGDRGRPEVPVGEKSGDGRVGGWLPLRVAEGRRDGEGGDLVVDLRLQEEG